jgi:hypothetical protein
LRFGGSNRGLGGAHIGGGELLLGAERDQGRAGRPHLGRRGLDIGLGRGRSRGELLWIDLHQGIASPHRLIVADQDGGDEAPHLGRRDRPVGLDIGRIGGDRGLGRHDKGDAGQGQDRRRANGQGRAGRNRQTQPLRRRHARDRRVAQNGLGHRSNTRRVEVAEA